MSRTTLNIDDTVLAQLKAIGRRDGRPLGVIASELLAQSLATMDAKEPAEPLRWHARAMRARVDIADGAAIDRILAGEDYAQ